MAKRMCGWMQFPDPGDASGDLYRCVDLILGMTGGLVDKDRSQGRVSRESECAAAHGGTVGEPTKTTYYLIGLCIEFEGDCARCELCWNGMLCALMICAVCVIHRMHDRVFIYGMELSRPGSVFVYKVCHPTRHWGDQMRVRNVEAGD